MICNKRGRDSLESSGVNRMVDITSWLNDTITVAPMTGVNDYGEATYGTNYTIKCRVERKLQKVVSAEGQEIMSNCEVAMQDQQVGLQDKVWLPEANTAKDDEARYPQNYAMAKDKYGNSYIFILYM